MRQDNAGQPDYAFAARCLLRAARAAALATQSDGQPYVALVTPAVAPDGAVLLLLSTLSQHTAHLLAGPRCAMMVSGNPTTLNPQTTPRVTIMGEASIITDDADQQKARRFWLAHHPYAAHYADFTDFAMWRLEPETGHYVGGFALAHKLQRGCLMATALAAGAEITADYNTNRAGELNHIVAAAGLAGRWHMLCVDGDGFDAVQDETVRRINFITPARDEAGVRLALRHLAQAGPEKDKDFF